MTPSMRSGSPDAPDRPFLDEGPHIRWSLLTPDRMIPASEIVLRRTQAAIDLLCQTPESELTYEKTLLGYERALRDIGRFWAKLTMLEMLLKTPKFREALGEVLPKLTAFYTGLTLNKELWGLFKAYSKTDDARSLTGPRRRHLAQTLLDFSLEGADLSREDGQLLARLNLELARLTLAFNNNVADSGKEWEIVVTEESRLAGLPPLARRAAFESAREKGLATEGRPAWRFTLNYSSAGAVMRFAKNGLLRKVVREADSGVGRRPPYDNTEIVRSLILLREEKAWLLGKENFADFVAARCMSGSGANALAFIEDLLRRAKPAFDREIRGIMAYKAEKTRRKPALLKPWEVAYWNERQRLEVDDFDDETLRPYFALSGVEKGLFELVSRLFGVTVKQRDALFSGIVIPASAAMRADREPVEVWNPAVKFFEMHDGDRHIGSFYTDMFHRATKRADDWVNALVVGGPREGGSFAPHLACIGANITPPSVGGEALLNHAEVIALFHEFGHLLHHLFSTVEIESLSGMRVPWDFVEMPALLFENWCWRRECLDLFARHHETGELIPEELLSKLIRSRRHRQTILQMRQLALAKLDLDIHLDGSKFARMDFDAYWNEELSDCQVPMTEAVPSPACRFIHAFGDLSDYAACYYSYKWSAMLAADVFSRFESEGVLNPKTGSELREKILSKGNSAPPAELFFDFMGRNPDSQALFRNLGID